LHKREKKKKRENYFKNYDEMRNNCCIALDIALEIIVGPTYPIIDLKYIYIYIGVVQELYRSYKCIISLSPNMSLMLLATWR
jgi:hypothetical protein